MTIEIAMFGGCTVSCDGRELAIANKKGKALLAYLAFSPNHSETRERLVGMFWSEMPEDKARANLRQTLRSLRDGFEAAGCNGFKTFHSEVGFEKGSVRFDIVDAIDSIANVWPLDVLLDTPRVTDQILRGFEGLDMSFDGWLAVQRESVRTRLLRDLEDRLAEQPGPTGIAKRLAQALLQLDPTHEPACQCVMRVSANAGDAAGAIAAYNALFHEMDMVHDHPPSEATGALISAIRDGSYRADDTVSPMLVRALPSPGRRPASEKLVLIVGAFDQIGARRRETLTFRHELISRLVKFREWSLIDGEPEGVPVSPNTPCYTLSAPLIEDGHDLHLMLSLKDTHTGLVVWNKRFDVRLETLFSSLQVVMREVAAELNVYISVQRLSQLGAAPDVALEIYDRWLRGQALTQSYDVEDRRRACEIFAAMITEAPNFSPAYSSLAQVANSHHIVHPGIYRTNEMLVKSEAWARSAIRSDPLCSRAQLCWAWWQAMSERYDQAAGTFELACRLNGSDAWTLISSALGLAFCDKPAMAMELAGHPIVWAPQLSSMNWTYQCQLRFVCGDHKGAVAAYRRVDAAIPYLPGWAAAALVHSGDRADARVQMQLFLAEMRAHWQGETAPTCEAILRWFGSCFPIRNENTRRLFREGLEVAASGLP